MMMTVVCVDFTFFVVQRLDLNHLRCTRCHMVQQCDVENEHQYCWFRKFILFFAFLLRGV